MERKAEMMEIGKRSRFKGQKRKAKTTLVKKECEGRYEIRALVRLDNKSRG